MQEKCCGAYNYTDYKSIGWSQTIDINSNNIDAKVPISCCRKKDPPIGDTPTSLGDFVDPTKCLEGDLMFINEQVFEFTALINA